jgi:hypothetical protein
MPRARPNKKTKEVIIMEPEATGGPHHSVSVDEIPAKKLVTYNKVNFKNINDSGATLEFSFNNKYYSLPDNCTVDLRKEVVDHLSSRVVRTWKSRKTADGNSEKYPVDSPRFVLIVKETFEKEE